MNFANDKERGKLGERKALEILSKTVGVIRVDDVSETKKYQKKDIDFIVHVDKNDKLKIYNVEAKTDWAAGQYGNFFIENKTTYTKDIDEEKKKGMQKQGWLHYSEADYFFIYVPAHKKMYTFKNKEIKDYIKNWHPRRRDCKDSYKDVEGYLVPIADFLKRQNVITIEI